MPSYWCSCMFTWHCPSLGCELLHSRDVPESSLVPNAHAGTWHNIAAAQQILVEFPFESNRNPTPILVWGRKLMETESPDGAAPWQGSPRLQSTHRHLLHSALFSFRCFRWLVLFQPILTLCLGKSQGNSTLLLELLPT